MDRVTISTSSAVGNLGVTGGAAKRSEKRRQHPMKSGSRRDCYPNFRSPVQQTTREDVKEKRSMERAFTDMLAEGRSIALILPHLSGSCEEC